MPSAAAVSVPDANPCPPLISLCLYRCSLCLFWIFRTVEPIISVDFVSGLSIKHGVFACSSNCSSASTSFLFHTLDVALGSILPTPISTYSMKWASWLSFGFLFTLSPLSTLGFTEGPCCLHSLLQTYSQSLRAVDQG